jgi:hypothetical protein
MLKKEFFSSNQPTSQAKSLCAAMLGIMIEWYDYGLFGYLAPVIADLFFPAQHKWVSLLQAFTVFAIGFMLRPSIWARGFTACDYFVNLIAQCIDSVSSNVRYDRLAGNSLIDYFAIATRPKRGR